MHLTLLEVNIFICYGIYCFIIIVFRLMCTVSAFFSVKCASGNYQILKGVVSKLQRSQTACFEPLYGDVCNQNLQPDQVLKRLSKNLKNQFNNMSLQYCYAQTTFMCDYSSPVCINGTRTVFSAAHTMLMFSYNCAVVNLMSFFF